MRPAASVRKRDAPDFGAVEYQLHRERILTRNEREGAEAQGKVVRLPPSRVRLGMQHKRLAAFKGNMRPRGLGGRGNVHAAGKERWEEVGTDGFWENERLAYRRGIQAEHSEGKPGLVKTGLAVKGVARRE